MLFKQPVINKNAPEFGSKEYIDYWYNQGGIYKALTGVKNVATLNKAIAPWDPPASPYGTYFEPKFSADVMAWVMRSDTLFRILPKTTFQRYGDSFKYFASDLSGATGVDGGSTPFASGSSESGPTLASFEEFKPAYIMDPWETDFTSVIESQWQQTPSTDAEWLRQYHAQLFPDQIDKMLTEDVDTVANDGSSNLNVESIDRICSDYTESGAGTTFVSAATDGDIYWGKSSPLVDRSADSGDVFGANVDLPATAAARVLSLDMIDDVVADCLDYAPSKNFIMVTGPRTVNEIEKLTEGKQRYSDSWIDGPVGVEYTVNGVRTRPGRDAGFLVSSYMTNGIRIPIFENKHVVGENGNNRTTKVTDNDIGNIYILNLDTVELRVALPATYWKTPPEARLTGDRLKDRHALMMGLQLICTNFRSNGAIKYLKSA